MVAPDVESGPLEPRWLRRDRALPRAEPSTTGTRASLRSRGSRSTGRKLERWLLDKTRDLFPNGAARARAAVRWMRRRARSSRRSRSRSFPAPPRVVEEAPSSTQEDHPVRVDRGARRDHGRRARAPRRAEPRRSPRAVRLGGHARAPHAADDVPHVFADARGRHGRRVRAARVPRDAARRIGAPVARRRERAPLLAARGRTRRRASREDRVPRAGRPHPSRARQARRGRRHVPRDRSSRWTAKPWSTSTSRRSSRSSSTSSTTRASTPRRPTSGSRSGSGRRREVASRRGAATGARASRSTSTRPSSFPSGGAPSDAAGTTPGVGLGLALARGLARGAGRQPRARSASGSGSLLRPHDSSIIGLMAEPRIRTSPRSRAKAPPPTRRSRRAAIASRSDRTASCRQLGLGGQGAVYLADDPRLGRQGRAQGPQRDSRALAEVRAAVPARGRDHREPRPSRHLHGVRLRRDGRDPVDRDALRRGRVALGEARGRATERGHPLERAPELRARQARRAPRAGTTTPSTLPLSRCARRDRVGRAA